MPSSCASTISDEVAELRRVLPGVEITAATDAFVSGSYHRTPYTKIRMTLTFPNGYPTQRPLIVDVQSCGVVPPGLKKKLEKDVGKVASDIAGNADSNESQVCAVFNSLVSFIDTNKFVPCWRELKQSIDIVKDEGGKVALNEARGKINITLTSQKYFYKFSVTVDDGYPTTLDNVNYGKPCRLKMESTNFPPKIEKLLTSQAMELIKRMQDGMPTEDALRMSNPVRLPNEFSHEQSKGAPLVRLTQDALKGLKHDVETLNLVRDLRDVDAATKQGDLRVKAHNKKERKDARRAIGKITQQELDDDRARDEKEKQWQHEEEARIAGYNFTEYDGSNPQPSLLAVVTFLTREVKRLTTVKCPICTKLALPVEPNDLKALYLCHSDAKTEKDKKARRMARLQRPERVYCGCWYHHKCLDKFIREPPFGAECATDGCNRRVYHNDWPADISELERAWAGKQARAREIEDASMFL